MLLEEFFLGNDKAFCWQQFAPAARVFSVKTRQINLKSFKTKNTRKDICGKS